STHILARVLVEERRAQAEAIQRIEVASMEVAFQPTLDVPHMCPSAMDAGIAQLNCHWVVRVHRADLVAYWRANLAAVGHISDIIRTDIHKVAIISPVLASATGYTAGGGHRDLAADECLATCIGKDVRTIDVVSANLVG